MSDRRVVLVLGMHRSGTSALAGALHVLGLGLPGNLLPPAPDNVEGYFESRDLARLDEQILAAAGTAWHDPAPIPDAWFASAGAFAFRERAEAFVNEALAESSVVVLKEPRLCRLLPFWRVCLTDLGVRVGSVLILRDPREVARSLQVRVFSEETRPAGTLSIARAHWLWLRYVLEGERGSRGLPRAVLTYEMLLDDGPRTLAAVAKALSIDYPVPLDGAAGAIERLLARKLKRQHHQGVNSLGWPGVAAHFYGQLVDQIVTQGEIDVAAIEAFRDSFESIHRQAASPNEKPIHSCSPAYASALTNLGRSQGALRDDARLLFVSDNPSTRGHIYRVEHHVEALGAGGLTANWCAIEDFTEGHLSGVTIVVVFRVPWGARVAALYAASRARGIMVVFDIDDLVFEPAFMREPYFDYMRTLKTVARERWSKKVDGWRRSLLAADCAIVSTAPLVGAAEALGQRARVWSNGVSHRMIEEARRVARPTGSYIRLGYASGAPTHQKDFAQVAAPLASILTARPDVALSIVGHLDLKEFPGLMAHSTRIERRPLVAHHELAAEYARFDVNLAPLEVGNPFCEAKSELKYFEAALVKVPTVAAATAPFAAAIQSGVNGFVARNEKEWRAYLLELIDDREMRQELGREARWHALVRFGPEAQCLDGLGVIAELAAGIR